MPRIRAAGQLRPAPSGPVPRRSARPSSPARRPRRCREATTDSLIWASSSSFSTRCFSAVRAATRSTRYRVRSRSRRIGGGGTKLGRSICRSATLHNHTASSRSVFGRPGRCLTSLALTSHGLEPVCFQQVERRPPVVAGRLHHHPGHPQLAQPVRQRQQRAGHRGVGADLLQPPRPAVRAGHPDAAHHLGLADVQRRDPLDDLLVVLASRPASPTSSSPATNDGGRPQELQGTANLILVLEATLKGPRRSSQRPTNRRPQRTKSNDVSGRPDPHFQPGTGRPPGRTMTR